MLHCKHPLLIAFRNRLPLSMALDDASLSIIQLLLRDFAAMTHSAPNVLERFLRYVQFDTQSDETSAAAPSTAKQLKLAEALTDELHQLGIGNAVIGQGGVVYAHIPASSGCEDLPAVGFIAHMDTSPDASGCQVKPQIIRFAGTDVLLNQTEGIFFPVERFPEIKKYIGEDVIFTDGTTLLGADDKSGIAAIMDMAAKITADPTIAHAKLCIAFTPDEEIGRGTDNFDLERFGADWAVTIDGGEVGTLESENFNAGSAVVDFQGVGVHPGSSKGKMVNALRMAAAFIDALPADMAPETTEGREGFLHPNQLEGTVTHAKLHLLIRDHDRALYEEKKVILERIAEDIQSRFPNGAVTLSVKNSYENMKPYIDRVPAVMEHVRAAANLTRSRIAVIKDRVRTICTPGETVDVLVTEWGIAVNPRRTDLLERFTKAKLPVHSIEKLREKAERLCGKARPIPEGERIVGIVEYRDGTIIDVVRARA